MRSVNFSGSSFSKVTWWQTVPGRQGTPERAPVFKMQYQPLPAPTEQAPAKQSWLERLKKTFTPREEHVQWMENSQSGLGLPASMSHSHLDKMGRQQGRS